jgi:DNA-directed RNA polymerase specialized sigma24 family protein
MSYRLTEAADLPASYGASSIDEAAALFDQFSTPAEELPEQDRRCLFLRPEGLHYREIASILDVSLGGISISLARSLARVAWCAKRCSL